MVNTKPTSQASKKSNGLDTPVMQKRIRKAVNRFKPAETEPLPRAVRAASILTDFLEDEKRLTESIALQQHYDASQPLPFNGQPALLEMGDLEPFTPVLEVDLTTESQSESDYDIESSFDE
jgi:hypothetical protein